MSWGSLAIWDVFKFEPANLQQASGEVGSDRIIIILRAKLYRQHFINKLCPAMPISRMVPARGFI